MAAEYDRIGVLTTNHLRGFMNSFLEAVNAGDTETLDDLRPYIAENARITLPVGNERVGLGEAARLQGTLTGFVDIHGLRVASDVRSGAGKVRLYRNSDAFFSDSEVERTPSGLMFGQSVNCGFQFVLTRERKLQLTRLTCD